MNETTANTDEMLKKLASEAVKQSETLRTTIRDLTLNALRARDLTVGQMKQVLKALTEGVSLGAAQAPGDSTKVLDEALAGMDEALLKAVEANHLALQQFANQEESQVQNVLTSLERFEDEFLATVKQAASASGGELQQRWAAVLKAKETSGTATGGEVAATMAEFADRMQASAREQRRAAVKGAQVLTESMATLSRGILIGLTEALQQGKEAGTAKGAKTASRSPAKDDAAGT